MSRRVLLAIPAYRCAEQIRRVIRALKAESRLRQEIERVIVFDNCSPDTTAIDALSEVRGAGLADWIHIVRNDGNYGIGGTHKLAFNYALEERFSHVIIFHGDAQGQASEIELILKGFESGHEAVLGSRFMAGSFRPGYSKVRTFGNHVLNLIFSALTFRIISDLGSGLNGFSSACFVDRGYLSLSNQFNFNAEFLLHLIRSKIDFVFVPITWTEEDQVSNARNFRVAIQMMKSLLKWRFGISNRNAIESYSFQLVDEER